MGQKPYIDSPDGRAAVIRMIELEREGYSYNNIACILNAEGYKTKREGTEWSASVVYRNLKSIRESIGPRKAFLNSRWTNTYGPDQFRIVDCFVGMTGIKPKSINLIVGDLPFGMTNNLWDEKWDLKKLRELWKLYMRVLAPRGVIVLLCKDRFVQRLMKVIPEGWLKKILVCAKANATQFYNAGILEMNACDFALVCYQTGHGKITYHPQMTHGERYKVVRAPTNHPNWGTGRTFSATDTDMRFPRDVLYFLDDKNKVHPTQKPLAMAEYIVRSRSNKGDVVLDHCLGSGTTAIACWMHYRRCIGFERDPDIYKRFVRRANKWLRDNPWARRKLVKVS